MRQQFEGVIWRFKTGGQWREMPQEFGAWSTVHNRRPSPRGAPRDVAHTHEPATTVAGSCVSDVLWAVRPTEGTAGIDPGRPPVGSGWRRDDHGTAHHP
ncbi:transposase [Streptomyces sp. NBC_00873]|uniref:transposase n=1 Tax=Streptomyces sp. NBC_00873 TaxID=2975852 RepID=UPI00386DDE31